MGGQPRGVRRKTEVDNGKREARLLVAGPNGPKWGLQGSLLVFVQFQNLPQN